MKLSNLDKLYWEKITKGDLLEYYAKVAPYILPYLKNRAVVLHRFPEGIDGNHFYQKNAGDHLPKFVKTFPIQHTEKKINYMVIQNAESLLYAVNLGSIELHTFNASLKSLENPDYMVFDLDPVDISFDRVVETALVLHEILEKIKVPNYCRTSGAKGLHIFVPLGGKYTFEQVKKFSYLIATLVHEKLPSTTSLVRSPAKRQKKVYIDYLQNQHALTMICTYAVRARPLAPVATPLLWNEVKTGLDPNDYNIGTVLKRLSKKGDLFKNVLGKGINLWTSTTSLESWMKSGSS